MKLTDSGAALCVPAKFFSVFNNDDTIEIVAIFS